MKLNQFDPSHMMKKQAKNTQESLAQKQQSATFGKLLDNKINPAAQQVFAADEIYKQRLNKDKEHIEDGKLMDGEEEESVLKTVNDLKKKLRALVELEQKKFGL